MALENTPPSFDTFTILNKKLSNSINMKFIVIYIIYSSASSCSLSDGSLCLGANLHLHRPAHSQSQYPKLFLRMFLVKFCPPHLQVYVRLLELLSDLETEISLDTK